MQLFGLQGPHQVLISSQILPECHQSRMSPGLSLRDLDGSQLAEVEAAGQSQARIRRAVDAPRVLVEY